MGPPVERVPRSPKDDGRCCPGVAERGNRATPTRIPCRARIDTDWRGIEVATRQGHISRWPIVMEAEALKLISEIMSGAIEKKEPISDLLRRCLVLAYKLKNSTLKAWVEKELNGYDSEDELPDYRKAVGIARGHFLGGFGMELRNQPLPASVLEAKDRHFATDIRLGQPIVAYETADRTKDAAFFWPADLVAKYQQKFFEHMALNRAWQEVPGSVIAGLVDTVRTRVLTFALQIQDELPDGEEEAIDRIPPAVVDRIFNVTINGGNAVFGNVGQLTLATVLPGDMKSLKSALKSAGIPDESLAELEQTLAEDGAAGQVESGLGTRTREWARNAARKCGDLGIRIGEEGI